MLASWLERGLGQILAPDEKHAAPSDDDHHGGFWSMVAPDPAYEQSRHGIVSGNADPSTSTTPPSTRRAGPPPSAFLSPPLGPTSQVICVHCHQWTPVKCQTPILPPLSSTPNHRQQNSTSITSPPLHNLVLNAATDTATSMTSPPNVAEARNKVFRLCASSKPLSDKLKQRLARLIQQDPSLSHARASRLGNLVPDGYTPFLAAVSANHMVAVGVLLDIDPTCLQHVDLQGRTALHLAAELGHVEMVAFLQHSYPEGPDAPVDLTGLTPFGRAVTSHHREAQQQQTKLQNALFSPGDVSVCGHPTPATQRAHRVYNVKNVSFGYADMPGFRVTMEDAVCHDEWHNHVLLGVCDGHGDQGRVSEFVATRVGEVLRQQLTSDDNNNSDRNVDWAQVWKTTCLTLDDHLREARLAGGSTGVFSLVTETTLVVANVGDSRCILIQKSPTTLEQDMANLQVTSDNSTTQEPRPFIVMPMSEDHKPDLPEERARIENAGLTVMSETFMQDDVEHVIYKVQRSESERMAVSRSFGDLEYKTRTDLAADAQAIVAVPEVQIHTRNHDLDLYLVLACDGVWDVMSNDEVADFVVRAHRELVDEDQNILPRVGDMLLQECLNRGSTDNMTVVIVELAPSEQNDMEGKALQFSEDES